MNLEINGKKEFPSLVDDNDNDNGDNELCGRKRRKWLVKHNNSGRSSSLQLQLQLPEIPTEIWVEILQKLPIKLLHASKCVSKTWHSCVSQVLTTLKGIDLPPYGLLFEIMRCEAPHEEDGVGKRDYYLAYLSLVGGNKLSKWLVDDNGESESVSIAINDHRNAHHGSARGLLLGNVNIDFGSLLRAISKTNEHKDWNMHRGLILATLDLYTYLVYNPATKEAFVLSRSVSEASLNRGSPLVAIINLTDCALSTECNFRVVRFVKAKKKGLVFVEVYSSDKHEWCVSKFRLERVAIEERWNVSSGVFVNNTLFFLTNKRHAVGVQFQSSGQVTTVYSLPLPPRITRGFCESRLDGSQGCLYLSYHKFPNLWIWKSTGSAWIPQLIFKESGLSLCQPVVENFLRQSVSDYSDTHPMFIHPEAPVVFTLVDQSIFALHLLDDTVSKIVELDEREILLLGTAFMYSPCFASFKWLELANQDHLVR